MFSIATKYRAFTLLELIIVVAILGVLFSTQIYKNIKKDTQEEKINIDNIKIDLINNFKFKEKLILVCIEEVLQCYIINDKKVQKIENLFSSNPQTYKYNSNIEELLFPAMKINESYKEKVVFYYEIDRNLNSEDLILLYNSKWYVYNSIDNTPFIANSFNEVEEYFMTIFEEIKNAF